MQSDIVQRTFEKQNEKEIEFDLVPLKRVRTFLETREKGFYERLEFYQLIHFTDGSGTHIVDFNSYEFNPGSSFYLSKYQVQKWDISDGTDGFLILFTEDFFSATNKDRMLLLDLEITFHDAPALPSDSRALISELFATLLREFERPPDRVKGEILRSLLRVLLLQFLRLSPKDSDLLDREREANLFLNFRRSLEKHFLTMRTVSEYAGECYVGPKKLNKVVQLYSGMTAKRYIDNRIILEAKRLLSSICETTQEAAFALEFEDPSYFVKYFKRHTGVTPSQFQASLQL